MALTTFAKLGGLPEVIVALVLGVGIWGSYGFPYVLAVATGGAMLGLVGAFAWHRSQRRNG